MKKADKKQRRGGPTSGILCFFTFCSLFFVFAPALHAQTPDTSVELYWEASSYTPPFYKGKALPPSDDNVVVTAFPPTRLGDPSKLIYTWKVNGTVLGSLSGVGKSKLTVTGSPFVINRIVVVTVKSADETQEAVGVVKLPVAKPKVVLYEDKPLLGVHFENALVTTEQNTDTDIEIVAYPFFFSDLRNRSGVSYRWTIGRQSVDDPEKDGAITARSDIAGTSTISVGADSLSHILQRASEIITVVLE